jgi:hypothetical protein
MPDSAPLPSRPPSRSNATAAAALVAAVVLAGGVFMGWQHFERRTLEENERMAPAALKTLSAANADFRSNDRDENRINDFWTGNVADLRDLIPLRGPKEPIKLIEQALAEADPTRPGARPYRGYWFRAMDTDDDGNPYRMDTQGVGSSGDRDRNNSKFAFCAYPAEYGRTGRWTYVVNEGNTIFKSDTGGKPILEFPSDSKNAQDYSREPE